MFLPIDWVHNHTHRLDTNRLSMWQTYSSNGLKPLLWCIILGGWKLEVSRKIIHFVTKSTTMDFICRSNTYFSVWWTKDFLSNLSNYPWRSHSFLSKYSQLISEFCDNEPIACLRLMTSKLQYHAETNKAKPHLSRVYFLTDIDTVKFCISYFRH